jgi:hypothetical protein
MILRHAHSRQQFAVHVNISARHFRRQPRGMQIEEYTIRIRNPPRSILHAVFEIDRHPRGIPICRSPDSPHPWYFRGIGMPDRFPAGMHWRICPRIFFGRFGWHGVRRRSHRRSLLVAILQQCQFRQSFLHFPFSRRTRIALQKIFISLLRQRRISQLVPPQLGHPQNRVLAIMARRIFVHQELVGIHRRLIVAAPKPVAHLRVHFGDCQQGIRHFRRARRNQRHAPIAGNHLLVIGQRALLGGFTVQRGALLLRARKLCGRGLPLPSGGGIPCLRTRPCR